MASIGDIIKAGITGEKTTEDILKDVYAAFPNANTKAASVAWYRSQMKKSGTAPAAPKKTKTAEAVGKLTETPAPIGFKAEKTKNGGTVVTPVFAEKKETFEDFKRAAGLPVGPVWEVRGFKKTHGTEGEGYVVNLYCDGVKVAEAADYADGGPVHWTWFDDYLENLTEINAVNYMGEPHVIKGTPAEKAFWAYCLALPKVVNPYDDTKTPQHVTPDWQIEEMVNDLQLAKQVRSLCKGRIAFLIDTDKGRNIYTIKKVPTPENIEAVRAEHKKNSCVVLNSLSEKDAVEELRKLQK